MTTVLHHVQVSCTPGAEDDARRFWSDALQLIEVDKPEQLRGRGGCWFRAYDGDRVTAEVHVGVERDFRPAAKAHPALLVDDLDAVVTRLEELGFAVDLAEERTFPGHRRLHTTDPHGNRVEILEAITAGS